MFLGIPDILTAEEVERLRFLAGSARFVDGRHSNPHSTVKSNLQIDQDFHPHRDQSSAHHQILRLKLPIARQIPLPVISFTSH